MVTCQTLLCVCVQYVGSIVIRFTVHIKERKTWITEKYYSNLETGEQSNIKL